MAQNVGMTSNSANLEKVLNSAARRVVAQRTHQVLSEAQSNPGSKDYPLRSTVEGRTHHDIEGRVGSNDPSALFAEEGTRPHIIRPRNARVLRFPGTNSFSGTTIFTQIVHHPGTRGSHFLRNALRRVIR